MKPAVSWLPGHGAKPDGWDPGAISPAGWREADLVRDVAMHAWRAAERWRTPTEIVSAGSYAQRGQDADAGAGSRLVVQLHADASPAETGPDVARVFYWPTSLEGAKAAVALAGALRPVLPWPVEVCAAEANTWPNARACLAAVRATSVLIELGFTDGVKGRDLLPGLAQRIGEALGAVA